MHKVLNISITLIIFKCKLYEIDLYFRVKIITYYKYNTQLNFEF
jgi:hypothetical protein